MTPELAAVIAAGLTLTPDERMQVVHELLRSVDDRDEPDQAGVDAAWSEAIGNRVDDVLSGKVVLLDVDESHAQLRDELAARRR